MAQNTIFDYYRQMGDSRVLLSFKGVFSQDTLVYLGDLVLNHVGFARDAKRVFSIYIEMAQNILFYSDERVKIEGSSEEAGSGLVMVARQADCYVITSGNLANNQRRDRFVQQVEFVNANKGDGLRASFKQNLRSPAQEGSKGAGNGIIEIGRKSDEPLRYEIHSVNPDQHFVVLTAVVRQQS